MLQVDRGGSWLLRPLALAYLQIQFVIRFDNSHWVRISLPNNGLLVEIVTVLLIYIGLYNFALLLWTDSCTRCKFLSKVGFLLRYLEHIVGTLVRSRLKVLCCLKFIQN